MGSLLKIPLVLSCLFPLAFDLCVLCLLRCLFLFWEAVHALFAESKKIQAECIQFKACFEAAIQSEGKASCNVKERREREGATTFTSC